MAERNQPAFFFHCRRCLNEMPVGESAATWARLEVGILADHRFQVWCVRHDCLVYEDEEITEH